MSFILYENMSEILFSGTTGNASTSAQLEAGSVSGAKRATTVVVNCYLYFINTFITMTNPAMMRDCNPQNYTRVTLYK
ncbi:hypothetical protein MASR1M74_23630 [Lentimicrobium sp.]